MSASGKNGGVLFLLNFHGLGEPPGDVSGGEKECWIDTRFFTEILNTLIGRSDVGLTFDDSNESDHAIALPLLKARGLRARFFVVADRIGKKGYLSKEQLRELCAEGMTIGSHGMRHRQWARLSEPELKEELVEARERLQQATEEPITEAACPFGSYNRKVLGKLRNAGYEKVYTSDDGPAQKDAWLQPRNTIVRSYDLKDVARIMESVPSGPKGLWRKCKLALKRWR
jgi:peptidoglycan/xylan/chitin deacetylase (PgdA/CDA1 family)